MEELKPCPFCNGKAEYQKVGAQKGSYCVKCTACWAKSVYVAEYDQHIAITAWNTRTTQQE